MENPKGRTAPSPKESEPQVAGAAPQQAAADSFQNISDTYWRSLEKAQVTGQEKYQSAHENYANDIRAINDDLQKQWAEMGDDFVKKFQEASGQPDAEKRFTEIQQACNAALRDAQDQSQKRFEDVNREFANALQQAQEQGADLVREAYRTYLRSQQEAWAKLDIDAMIGKN